MSTISRGVEVELLVASILTQNGISVSLPVSHDNEYDIVADNGNNLLKIQVKRAFWIKNKDRDYLCVETKRQMTRHSDSIKIPKKDYSIKGYDFLITCDIENNDFWIIPREVTKEYKSQIYLNIDKLFTYKDNWSLLKS